ncbi:BppU family phage baseplate upper protein [Staphylococcus haemolyticus]|uniref:BppU family phage baseplate upper protein n=1 Tax=Staphylococcus haemolyticus TaxID=1283 RepID=UPI001F27521A|nr:BppU family phage baseplate upper protein [Staphylococcus haemolyticus]MCE4964427.1 BppU family phage baseplate upper protein [Staphylococcus haemolyticus]
MLQKMTDVSTNINVSTAENGFIGANFYTEDDGSAYIRITIKDNNQVLDFNKTDMLPRLDLFCSDGSIFTNEPLDILIPDKGVIQYKVSDNVIAHPGRMDAKLFLANKNDSIHVANFYFTITDSGMTGPIGKEISVELLEKYVANVMSKNAMGLLSDDYRERLETEIKKYIIDNNKSFNLKFEDLTREEKNELMKNLTNQGLADFRIEDNSILNEKLVDGTIKPEKTSFFNIGKNLLNPNTALLNKSIDSNGNIIDAKNYFLSELIPFDATGEISFTNGNYVVGLYDKDKNFYLKTGVTNSSSYELSANSEASYFRIATALGAPETIMVNYGGDLLPFEQFYKELKPEFIPNIDFDSLKNVYIGPDKLTNYIKSKNLFNKNNVMIGKTIDSKGTLIDDSNYVVSSKIKVEGDKVAFSTPYSAKCVIYDENDTMLGIFSKLSNQTTVLDLTKYPKAKYFVIIASLFIKDDFMANYGETVLPYEEFAYTLVTTDQYPIKISSDIIPKTLSGGTNNSSDNVVNLNDLSNTQQLVKDNNASLNSGENLEILNTTNKTQLDYIEFSSSAVDLELEITYTDKDGQKIVSNIIKPDDNSKLPLTIENVVSYGYPNTDFLVYDVSRKLFKIAIKDLNFSNGVEIKLKNNGTSSINGSAKLVGRYYV